ncbi:hypothetical protein GCM10027403_05920 [Arthrobacter tecti]
MRHRRATVGVISSISSALIFLAWQIAQGPGPIWADTVQYLRIAFAAQGMPADEAWMSAYSHWCEHPSVPHNTPQDVCTREVYNGEQPIIGVSDRNPQYQAIFSPRLGYPLLSIPLMNLLGVHVGLWIIPLVLTVLSGMVLFLVCRSLNLGVLAASTAQALFYVLPVGYHGVALLTEGPAMFFTLVILLGAVLLAKGQLRNGALVTTLGFVTLFFFKYSAVLITSVSFLGIVILLLLVPRFRKIRGLRLLALLMTAYAAASFALTHALNWPGMSESLQDTFTKHFELPPVPNPIERLLLLNADYLRILVNDIHRDAAGAVLVVLALGAYAAFARTPQSWLPLGVSLVGIGTILAHPVASQAERLGSPFWVGIAVGIAIVVERLTANTANKVAEEQNLIPVN